MSATAMTAPASATATATRTATWRRALGRARALRGSEAGPQGGLGVGRELALRCSAGGEDRDRRQPASSALQLGMRQRTFTRFDTASSN
jgi:hypothetical protein